MAHSYAPLVHLKAVFLKLRKINGFRWIQLSTYCIAIIGFLTAIEYFSGKPSIKISITPQPMGFYMDSAQEFYTKNKIPIPKNKLIGELFFKKKRLIDENHLDIGDGTADFDLIKSIKSSVSSRLNVSPKVIETKSLNSGFKPRF